MVTYRWNLSDLNSVEATGYKAFSTFSCGGGSSLGYKLAGFEVVGNIEIDKKINGIYCANLKPKLNYNMDIRDFLKLDNLPPELYDLELLDGSPPCTPFSTAGDREKGWQKKKRFAEGNIEQTLDDLFLEFIKVADKLKPKIIIAENVKGLLFGNAKGYVNMILNGFKSAGYMAQMFLLNATTMGVPQRRERVFFVCRRLDLGLDNLILEFNERPITFGEVKDKCPQTKPLSDYMKSIWNSRKRGDHNLGDILKRTKGNSSLFNYSFVYDKKVCHTLTASCEQVLFDEPRYLSNTEMRLISSWPLDYKMPEHKVNFICGMSVPPLMAYRLAQEVKKQWLDKLNLNPN